VTSPASRPRCSLASRLTFPPAEPRDDIPEPHAAREARRVSRALVALSGAAATLLLAVPAFPQDDAASACTNMASSCNEDRSVCCEWWTIDTQPGAGALVEDSYEKLQKSLASDTKAKAMLCRYWGDSDDCNASWGPPRCSGGGADGNTMRTVTAQGAARISESLSGAPSGLRRLDEARRALSVFSQIQAFEDAAASGTVVHRAASSTVSLVRDKLMEAHKTLDEYATVLKGGVDRAQTLRSQAAACYRSVNPFYEMDHAVGSISLGYGFPLQTNDLPTPTSPDGRPLPFSPPSAQDRQGSASADGRIAMRRVLTALQHLPAFPSVQSAETVTVLRDSRSGRGRILSGAAGSLKEGQLVHAIDVPFAFVTVIGQDIVFGTVHVSKRDASPGEIIEISGSGSQGRETVELLACGTGQTMRGDRCACSGEGMVWTGAACGCPTGEHQENGSCRSCGGGSIWSGSACVCPTGTVVSGQSCVVPSCPSGTLLEGASCVSISLPETEDRFKAIPERSVR
jgi:hypothetical protein